MPAIVFVHGLGSTCEASFPNMIESFRSDYTFNSWDLRLFNYDSLRAVASNGDLLRSELSTLRRDGNDIYIIAHSMGGLVARYACLSETRQTGALARRLIMLGTPNFGALLSSQLNLLSQLFWNSSLRIIGYRMRAAGVRDLTRITEVFQDAFRDGLNYTATEYATIPGTYFNDSRLDLISNPLGRLSMQKAYVTINLLARVFRALPAWMMQIALLKPHDGIVEESSVKFVPPGPGRWSEINEALCSSPSSYVHILHRIADDLMHNDLTNDEQIIDLVKGLVLSPSISDWRANQLPGLSYKLRVEP